MCLKHPIIAIYLKQKNSKWPDLQKGPFYLFIASNVAKLEGRLFFSISSCKLALTAISGQKLHSPSCTIIGV